MSETVADFTQQDENALLNLDRAHNAYEKVENEIVEALSEAQMKVYERFNPILFESRSVLYEAMGKAAKAGFTYAQLRETMNCDNH